MFIGVNYTESEIYRAFADKMGEIRDAIKQFQDSGWSVYVAIKIKLLLADYKYYLTTLRKIKNPEVFEDCERYDSLYQDTLNWISKFC